MRRCLAIALAVGLFSATGAAPAQASVFRPLCKILAPACSEAGHGLTAGRQLLTGHVGGAVGTVVGGVAGDVASLGLGAIASWAAGGASYALHETATLIDTTSTPRLQAPWFQRVYWRLAAIAVLLTLPCLLAAAVQALIRSDLPLLARAAFAYLPAAMLGVGICAQITSLLLAAVDELCALVSGAAGQSASAFLNRAGAAVIALSTQAPFLSFVIAAFTVAGAIVLWLELMMRAAAVYVVVAMLPLAFAAFVWPARRVWALRAVELLAALILAKLAMITVLTLGGAALESAPNVAGFLAGLVLLILGVFSPWAMLRMVPMAELASGAVGRLRAEMGVPSLPELPQAAAQGAAHNLGASAAAQLHRGRAAAESVMAQMGSNGGTPDPGPEPAVAGEPDPHAPPSDLAASAPDQPPPRRSRFSAENFSWAPIELSGQARWREQPPWRDDEAPPIDDAPHPAHDAQPLAHDPQPPAHGAPSPPPHGATADPGAPPPSDPAPPAAAPPELPPGGPFASDGPDLGAGDE